MHASKVTMMMIALGLLAAAVSVATAAAASTAAIDFTAAQADSAAAHVDSTLAMPVTPAPAAATTPPAAAPTEAKPAAAATKSGPNDKIYYGGTVTASFGTTTSIGFWPMLAYKFTPKLSGGVEAGYEYLSYGNNQNSSNYGAALFGRFRVGRNLYAHAEYQNINYEIFTSQNSSRREWVPAILLGGGYVKNISPRTSVYGEVLFDVLQDNDSPYKNWDPIVNVGVAVGF